MKQVVLEKKRIAVKDVPSPILDDYGVLVAVYYSCISSGTESSTIAQAQESFIKRIPDYAKKIMQTMKTFGISGTKALVKEKLAGGAQGLGYSCSGCVLAVGKKVRHVRVGDWVACAGAGYANHAQVVYVPGNLVVRMSDERHVRAASITTIGAIALQGLRRAQVQLGETVAVIGLGLLGQITVQLARNAGCNVIGLDLIPERLEKAKKLGARAVYNAHDPSVVSDIMFAMEHHGVDCTIVTAATASDSVMQQAFEITRKKGKIVIVGDIGLSLQRQPWYEKEIDVLMSCSYGPGRYDASYEKSGVDYPYAYVRWTEQRNMRAFLEQVESGAINFGELVSHEYELDEAERAYDHVRSGNASGVILKYPYEINERVYIPEVKPKNSLAKDSTLRNLIGAQTVHVGVVGVGGFARVKLLPILSSMKTTHLTAFADTNSVGALSLGRLYNVQSIVSDYTGVLENAHVDAVVIATPHMHHTQQAFAALAHKKAVFVEKPLVTTHEDLEQWQAYAEKYSAIPLCVDFNRSFAPYIQKIVNVLERRSSPVMITYRMNAGYIPADHWVHSDVGGGRIIGEVCHIIDLFYTLVKRKPVSLIVDVADNFREDMHPHDNVSLSMKFDDGSLCTLLYTALGHTTLAKERMEVFFDGKSIVLDDYQRISGFGLPRSFDESALTQNKGHEPLMRAFFDALRTEDALMPISMQRILDVSRLSLLANKMAKQGGGYRSLLT